MDCLKNYIQIEGCNSPQYKIGDEVKEASGLYINKDLPLSLEQIDKIADSEQQTFLVVWDEVQNRAIKKFIIDVKAGYKELFGVCGLQDDFFCDNKDKLAMPLLYFLGAEIMFERMYSSRINRYTTIDAKKAVELRKEFLSEYKNQLKSSLEIINGDMCSETGQVMTYIESIP
jgi:hypothetical protein